MGLFWAEPQGNELCKEGNFSSESKTSDTAGCPILHDSKTPVKNIFNKLNNMPAFISDKKQNWQKLNLSTKNTTSKIPKNSTDEQGNSELWEFPSPQKMYNAMLFKGKIDLNTGEEIPEDGVESMVYVHNYLSEGCWQEILEWEKPYIEATQKTPKLWKFEGKPSQLSPRARFYHMLGILFPSKFSSELPFDRHDWHVLRPDPSSKEAEHPGYSSVRYVIDFYAGPDDENGLPTFHLSLRPGLDSFTSAKDRFLRWGKLTLDDLFPKDKHREDEKRE